MFVITADQVDSTHREDVAGDTLDTVTERFGSRLALPPDRTAGDEVQMLVADAATALEIITTLTRDDAWSVGCGIGGVRLPLPSTVRAATGAAFVAAREAVDRAKRAPHRFALIVDDGHPLASADVSPIVDLLLFLRSRRSPEGWEIADLLAAGMTQSDAADALGISPQAVSQRARTAGIRTEQSATTAIVRLLATADGASALVDDQAAHQNGH